MFEIYEDNKLYYIGTARECAKRLGVTQQYIYKIAHRGKVVYERYTVIQLGKRLERKQKRYNVYLHNELIGSELTLIQIYKLFRISDSTVYDCVMGDMITKRGYSFKEV